MFAFPATLRFIVMPLITQIFSFLAILYAVVVKCRRREWLDAAFLTMVGGIALYNSLFMYGFFTGEIASPSVRCVQQVISSMILPVAYMFFARQMGHTWFNSTTIALWSLMLLLLVPSGLHTLDGVAPQPNGMDVAPMMLYFFSDGNEVFNMHTADVILLIQGLLTLCRLVALVLMMRRYRLGFSPHLRYFLAWCGGMVAFIIFTSVHNTQELSQPLLLWTYYVSYSALIVTIFILLAQDFNLRPVMLGMEVNENDDENETLRYEIENLNPDVNDSGKQEVIVVEDVDKFILLSKALAELMHQMIDKGFYLTPETNMDDVARELGTNRTYLSRMLKAEFNTTFSELVTSLRMAHAETLLRETNLSIMEIAMQSGFADDRYFARRFKKIHGISPVEYRKDASV